ncbi:MAG TPA: ABC transporter permease [Candidatus Polarisedimenticolia bacterium]|nr:ABC transporter permease [Candidatus Polarisedimenticolia bacterium]
MTLLESVVDGVTDIRAHKGRTALQAVGVILGVASVVTVLALVDAGRRKSLEFMDTIGGLRKVLVVNEPARETTRTARQLANVGLTFDDAAALRGLPMVTQVDPIANERLLVRRGDYQKEMHIDGVTPDYQAIYRFYPGRGRFVSSDDLLHATRVVVLGDTAAREIFGSEEPLGRTLFIGDVGMTVVGVMQRKEYLFNNGTFNALEWMNRKVIVPLTTVHKRFTGDPERRVAFINAMIDKAENIPKAKAEIEALVRRRHYGEKDFAVWDRASRLEQQQQQSQQLHIVFLAAGAVSLLVGGIVIMNILLASFQERVREVGVRKALGANGLHITAQFLVESVLVTLLGGAAGLALGTGFARAVSGMLDQPAVITPSMALIGFITSVSVGIFFGLYPAVKAARLSPVQALRCE